MTAWDLNIARNEGLSRERGGSDEDGARASAPGGDGCGPISCCVPTQAVPWLRLVIGIFIAAQTMLFAVAVSLTPPDDPGTLLLVHAMMLAATLLVMALLGWPLLVEAMRELLRRRLTMELFFLAGIGGAFGASVQSMVLGSGPVYFDVVSVLLIVYSVGRALNLRSRQRAMSVMRQVAEDVSTARLIDRSDGNERIVDVARIEPGDRVRVMPGELIPVDGRIVSGEAMVRTTPFTGEWVSRSCRAGDAVLAGTGCEDASLEIAAAQAGTSRRVDRLVELIEEARQSPSHLQRQADRLVKWFLPIVVLVAAGSFYYWTQADHWHTGLFIGLSVLLVACSCATGLATPLAVWTVLGRLAQRGLVLRSGDAVERLAAVDAVIFDKTGTLGDERLALREIETAAEGPERSRTLAMIAAVEKRSRHPVAKVLQQVGQAAPYEADESWPAVRVQAVSVLPGRGIEAKVLCDDAADRGRPETLRIERDADATEEGLLRLRVSIDGQWAATLSLAERLRDSAERSVGELSEMGLPVHIMTGDSRVMAAATARALGEVTAEMTPEEKHRQIRRWDRPLFVGDGLNDAAAMAASHASIALASGSAVAVETASATLHGGNLRMIPEAVALSRRAVRVIRSNLRWAVFYNVTGVAVAAMGYLHPIIAALLMTFSSALVGWRSFRVTEERAGREKAHRKWVGVAGRVSTGEGLTLLRRSAHWAGLMGQGAVLVILAALSLFAGAGLLLLFAAGAWLLIRAQHRLPLWTDHTVAMVSLGGLGMVVGWWADVGFAAPFADGSAGAAICACCIAAIDASVSHSSHWMYAGMIALGVPAMYWLRRARVFEELNEADQGSQHWSYGWLRAGRRWCCIGPLVIGVPAMCIGMWAGAMAAAQVQVIRPEAQVLLSYVLMMLGMSAGMLLPDALQIFRPTNGMNREDARGVYSGQSRMVTGASQGETGGS